MGGLRSFEWFGGDFKNINIEGVSFIHHDKDHNKDATDMPFNYCNILYCNFKLYEEYYIFAIAVSEEVGKRPKYYRKWGSSRITSWTEL